MVSRGAVRRCSMRRERPGSSDDADAAVRLARAAEHADVPLVEATIALGAYAWDTGDRRTSIDAFERVAPLLDEIADPDLRARALYGLGRARVPTNPHEVDPARARGGGAGRPGRQSSRGVRGPHTGGDGSGLDRQPGRHPGARAVAA